jgi:hypothetical protein
MQVTALVLVLLLSGCNWFTKKETSGTSDKVGTKEVVAGDVVVATMGGKPMLTLKEFEERFEQLLAGQPQLRAMMQYMPDLKVEVAKSLVSQSIIDKYVKESGLDKSAEYKNDLEQARSQAQTVVNIKHFRKSFEKPVTAEEVKAYYDEHKDDHPELLRSRGGVPAVGVSFDKEADAKAFQSKVAGKNADEFKKVAESEKLGSKVRNFGLVNAQSLGMDATLRDKIISLKKPATELVKVNDKTVWVVHVGAKEEAQYRPFEEVKSGLEKYLADKKVQDAMDQKLEELKTKYDIKVMEDVLKPAAAQKTDETKGEDAQQSQPAAKPA